MIVSKDNQHLKLIRQLQKKKGREETGLFIAEGRRLIGDLLAGGMSLKLLLYADSFADADLAPWISWAQDAFPVAAPLLDKLSETEHGQGLIAVFRQKSWQPEAINASSLPFVFILSGVKDPGNLGTMMRNSAAAGASGLLLTDDTAEPYNPKTVRSSMGAIGRLPVYEGHSPKVYADLKALGFRFYLADMEGTIPYWQLPLDQPVAVIMGNEGTGPSDFWRQKADATVSIPLSNSVESLNVAMAQGIIAFDRKRRQGEK